MTDDEKVAEYERRITPIREAYDREQNRIEADARFRAGLLVAQASQRYTCGRYWAIGPALAAMEVQPDVDAIEAQLNADIADRYAAYQRTAQALKEELGIE